MKPKTIYVDDVRTEIRPMGNDYIIGDDPDAAGIIYSIKCWPGKRVPEQWPNAPIVAYFRKIMDAYGTGAITAWQGKKLIGFLPFMPINCGMPQMAFCVCAPFHEQTPLKTIEEATPIPFDQLHPKIIKVQCASVSPDLYRKGIGSEMAGYLVEWAKTRGWEKIQGFAFSNADFSDAYKWLPSIHFWERSGFDKNEEETMNFGELGENVPVTNFTLSL